MSNSKVFNFGTAVQALKNNKWKATGNIRSMYLPAHELLNEIRTAYQERHGGKKPKTEEALVWALCEGSDQIQAALAEMKAETEAIKKRASELQLS